ncbi:MAG: NIPSNAP family protein [Planctomycetia bacterium]|nr:NIPSNAP family protein [Planctomycetia bacterium]
MERRDFITSAVVGGLAATATTARADLIIPGRTRTERRARPVGEVVEEKQDSSYILLEFFYAETLEKRNVLAKHFDAELIPLRQSLGFSNIGVFTFHDELMANERGDYGKYANAVFVAQETYSSELLLNYQKLSAKNAPVFNLSDDLEFVDEEIIALKSFVSQPHIDKPNSNPERLLQLRTYNSPNYERNVKKEGMFEDGELDLFRRCGMAPVFFGSALFGSWAPNVTYMLSFPSDEARREGWSKFVNSEEWKKMSKDEQYARTATRIRNIFLVPTENSQI